MFATSYRRECTHYLLTIDGHGSRNGLESLQECSSNGCEVVLSPANTSHFLQPCDQRVNKTFNTSIRDIRDAFNKSVVVQIRGVQFNLMCGVHAFEAVTVDNIRQSFQKTGLFPFDENFPNRFMTSKTQDEISGTTSVGQRTKGVRRRVRDRLTLSKVLEIAKGESGASKKLQELTILLRNAETVNSILMNCAPSHTASTAESSNVAKRNVHLDCGAPAEHLTVEVMLARRR